MKKTGLTILFFTILLSTFVIQAQSNSLTIASYNIRYDNPDDIAYGNGWEQRSKFVFDLIKFHDFDIFGTQEGLYHQLENIKAALPEYSYTGKGRDDGNKSGEHSAIFYKKDRFTLLDNGNFWLSEDTEIPNKGWDAVCIRICSWAKLKEKETGLLFYFFNLHMDHVGQEAQKKSTELVLSKIKNICGNDPVILTGDFNFDQNNKCYKEINSSGLIKDSFESAEIRYVSNGSYNAFNPNSFSESRIDHIFVSGQFNVERYGILTDSYRIKNEDNSGFISRLPSDHFPVMIRLTY